MPEKTQDMRNELTNTVVGADGMIVPHYRSFQAIFNTASRMHSSRWDEAMIAGRENAKAMWRDAYMRALWQERCGPLAQWPWAIEADPDEIPKGKGKDPYSVERMEVGQHLEAIARRTKDLHHVRQYMGQSVWYGRYGTQVRGDWVNIGGFKRYAYVETQPVNGDKIHYDFDGVPGVMVMPGTMGPGYDVRTFDNVGPVLMLNTPKLRQRFIIGHHIIEDADYTDPQQVGRVKGVGLRDFVYWAWWLRDEMLAWITDFMEKVGNLGLLLFYYPEGNDKAKANAEKAAREARGKNALAVPAPKGSDQATSRVEMIPANLTGAQFLKDIIGDYFERHIERLWVGQSLSAGTEGSGLGGTGVAQMHNDTKFNLLSYDAENQAATFTEDMVRPLQKWNYPLVQWRYLWKYKLPDPKAEARVKSWVTVKESVKIKEDELYRDIGYSIPTELDKTVGGPQAMPGMNGMPSDPNGIPADGQPPGVAAEGENPLPGMPELVTAMVRAGSQGNVTAVNALARLGQQKKLFSRLIGESAAQVTGGDYDDNEDGDTDDPGDVAGGVQKYQWTAATTTSGKVKAVWNGPGVKAPLYGADAEAALRGGRGGPDEGLVPEKKKAYGGARAMQQFKQAATPHRAAAAEVYDRAVMNPGSVKPEELPSLAQHITTMTTAELRQTARELGQRSGGLKEDVVRRLLEHVGADVGGAGNQLNTEENRKRSTDAEGMLKQLSWQGPWSAILDEEANNHYAAKTAKQRDAVKRRAGERIRQALSQANAGGTGGNDGANQPRQDVPPDTDTVAATSAGRGNGDRAPVEQRPNPTLDEAMKAPDVAPATPLVNSRENATLDEAMGRKAANTPVGKSTLGAQTQAKTNASKIDIAKQADVLKKANKIAQDADINDPMGYGRGVDASFPKNIPDSITGKFDSHGTGSLKTLTSLLNGGIDPNRTFYSSPLSDIHSNLGSGTTVRGNSSFVVLGHPGKTLKESGIAAVLVDGHHAAAIEQLRQAFPNVKFVAAKDADKVLAKVAQGATGGLDYESKGTSDNGGNAKAKPPEQVERDIFGNALPKRFTSPKGKQVTMDDAIREAWVTKMNEWAAENGTKVDKFHANGTFEAGGKKYQVGNSDNGYAVTPVGSPPGEPQAAPPVAKPAQEYNPATTNKVKLPKPKTDDPGQWWNGLDNVQRLAFGRKMRQAGIKLGTDLIGEETRWTNLPSLRFGEDNTVDEAIRRAFRALFSQQPKK